MLAEMHTGAIRAITAFFLLCLSGCGVTPQDLATEVRNQRILFEPVLVAIERYRNAQGAYPAALSQVEGLSIPTMVLPFTRTSLYAIPLRYEVSRDRDFIRLTYGIADKADYRLHAVSSYLSTAKTWDASGHIEGFAHVEAGHYGAQYVAHKTAKSLEFAMGSLLEAAKSNSAYPCRNLWQGWIDKNFGAGEAARPELPGTDVKHQSRMYVAENGEPVFGLVFESKTFGGMSYPLSTVTAVYRYKDKSGWSMAQTCDTSPDAR